MSEKQKTNEGELNNQGERNNQNEWNNRDESNNESRDDQFMDVDRMINEGLGGGNVTMHNGYIGASTTDVMGEPDSIENEVENEMESEVVE